MGTKVRQRMRVFVEQQSHHQLVQSVRFDSGAVADFIRQAANALEARVVINAIQDVREARQAIQVRHAA